MKKSIIIFVLFLLIYCASLGLIYYKTSPNSTLTNEADNLEWNGHVENEFGTYDGSLIGDLYSGTGRFKFLTGEVYVGNWQDSEMLGTGVLTFPEIGEYSGDMNGSVRDGQGEFSWYSGEKYTGSWKEDEMSGEGKYVFSNGIVMEGIFKNNKPVSGKIDYSSNDNNSSSISSLTYTFNETERKLEFKTFDGLSYNGDISGLFGSGKADIIYPSGNTYSGNLNNGKRSGTGIYSWKDSSGTIISYYDGNWKDDHMDGNGKYYYSSNEYPYLVGSFVNDVPTGSLTYYKEAGNTFETQWENGTCIDIKES